MRGAAGASAIGLRYEEIAVAAATFYVLPPTLGWGAMLPAWMLFWICFAVLQHAFRPELLNRALGADLTEAAKK